MGLRDDAEETARIGQPPPTPPEERAMSEDDWISRALRDEMIKTADLSRRIGFALGMARDIARIARDQADVHIKGGQTILRDAGRLITMLETGKLPE